MKRILIALALLVSSVVPSAAQLTTMPDPLIAFLNNSGAVLDAGGLCVFRAGTSTLATTYTTAAGSTPNANPVLFASSGRATSGGVFLTPGQSYKFILKDFTGVVSPTCIPDTGTTIYTVDNVQSVPSSNVTVDVDGVAGESITSGDVVYLSDGSGAKVAGQWFKADADFTYASVTPEIGIAVTAIASGATGSIRIQGRSTNQTGLTTGANYYVSATAGALTATAPANSRFVGQADSTTGLVTTPNPPPATSTAYPSTAQGRLTLTTGVPVTTADVTAATTIYYAPYAGNQIGLYDGTRWNVRTFTQTSIAVPATTSTVYDIWAYDNNAVVTLELLAWTNATTRATALTTQDGIYVKTGALTRRYLGTFRTTAVSGQTEDTAATCRCLWNYYNRVRRALQQNDTTISWPYTVATWRQQRATATNQVAVVVGVAESIIDLTTKVLVSNGAGSTNLQIAIGEDSTTTPISAATVGSYFQNGAALYNNVTASVVKYPAVGYHTYVILEASTASDITTWFGANSTTAGVTAVSGTGIYGWIEG